MSSTSASSEPNATSGRRPEDERVLVGVVGRAHGLRGEVKVEVLTDVDGRFAAGSRLYLVVPGRAGDPTEVVRSRRHHGAVLLTLDGISDRDAAEALRGARLEVEPDEVPQAPEGFYYHFQLVGCECHDSRAGHLGSVCDVVEDGGGSLLVVEKDGRRIPIPFVDAFLREVDVVDRRIELSLPEGLIETCTSRS